MQRQLKSGCPVAVSHELTNIMKKIILSIPLLLLLFTACRKTSNPAVFDLGVHLQGGFDQDHVEVFIDNQPLLKAGVTTELSLGVAKAISTTATEGNHSLKIIVNGSDIKTESFSQSNNLYIGVQYNKSTKKIETVYSLRPYAYN